MEEGKVIYAVLTAASGVTALVGLRIYPDAAPQKATFPFVVYMSENKPVDSKDGHTGTDMVRYVAQAWADNPDDAAAVGHAIRQATHFYNGTVAGAKVTMAVEGSESMREETSAMFLTQVTIKARIT